MCVFGISYETRGMKAATKQQQKKSFKSATNKNSILRSVSMCRFNRFFFFLFLSLIHRNNISIGCLLFTFGRHLALFIPLVYYWIEMDPTFRKLILWIYGFEHTSYHRYWAHLFSRSTFLFRFSSVGYFFFFFLSFFFMLFFFFSIPLRYLISFPLFIYLKKEYY